MKRIRNPAARAALLCLALLAAGCAGVAGPDRPSSPAPVVRAPSSTAPSSIPATESASTRAPAGSPGAAPVVTAVPTPAPPDTRPAPAPGAAATAGAPVAPVGRNAPAPAEATPVGRASVEHRDLWSRVRAGFAMPELASPLVEEKERFYLARPDALQRMFARGGRYLHFIVEEVEKRGMPTEIALLPFVESAMNPVALSSASAAGLWQFIPSTGRQYELSQNWWVDNRRDVVQSTRAALDYLQKIHEMHDRDWFLALASYNWGENAVARAVKANRARGLPTDYLSLSMPAETRHYVPKLIALKHIVSRAEEYGIALPDIPNRPYFATIEKTRPIDLKLAAQFAGMSVEEFVALNPAHNRPVISATRNNGIKLPADRVDAFVEAIDRHERSLRPLASWQPYTLKTGETLDDVARRGKVSTAELLQANGLAAGRRILPGTQLIAPQAVVKDERLVESFEGPKVYEQVAVPAVHHVVTRRETLASVASSYGVGVATLRSWNGGVKTARPGTTLLVRPATTQTVLTQADGSRRVVATAKPPAPVATLAADPRAASRSKPAAAPKPAAPPKSTTAAVTAGRPKARPSPAPVRAVYTPPRAASGRAAARAPRPRT